MKILLIILVSINAFCCSSFFHTNKDLSLMAKNFDWHDGKGEVLFRPISLKKKSVISDFTWVSDNSSITFTQFGPDSPVGGINDKGLAIEALLLSDSRYPEIEDNSLNEGEWIQFNLDKFSTTREVINFAREISVKKIYVPAHYFVCDKIECAIFEYLNSKLVIHENLQLNQLTNNSYDDSILSLTQDGLDLSQRGASLGRFKRLSETPIEELSIKAMFEKLSKVKLSGFTQWSLVYNLSQPQVILKSAFSPQYIQINFPKTTSCQKEILGFSIDQKENAFHEMENYKEMLSLRLAKNSKIPNALKLKLSKLKAENNCQ